MVKLRIQSDLKIKKYINILINFRRRIFMKKILIFLVILMISAGLIACGGSDDPPRPSLEITYNGGTLNVEQNAPVQAGVNVATASVDSDATITYAVASGSSLPAGLNLAANGAISGTPTAAPNSYTVSIVASAAGARSATAVWTIVVVPEGTIVITWNPAALAGGTEGVAYSATISPASATGGAAVTYVNGTPAFDIPGLTLNLATREISGNPTAAATYTFAVIARATDAEDVERTLTIVIAPPAPVITHPGGALLGGLVGTAYSDSITASVTGGGTVNFAHGTPAFSIPGLSINLATGAITGNPSTPGEYSFQIVASSQGAEPVPAIWTIIVSSTPTITFPDGELAVGIVGEEYSATIPEATTNFGGTVAYANGTQVFNIPGLELNAVTGAITGIPTTQGSYSFQIVASAATAASVTATFTIEIEDPIPFTSFDGKTLVGTVGLDVNASVADAVGPASGITYALPAGSTLPTGLGLSAAGLITGTVNAQVLNHEFVVRASAAGYVDADADFVISVIEQQIRFSAPLSQNGVGIFTGGVLPNGTVGVPLADTSVAAATGAVGITYSATLNTMTAGNYNPLPGWLTVSAAGAVTGTPTAAATTTIRVTASAANSASAVAIFTLVVQAGQAAAPTQDAARFPDWNVGAPTFGGAGGTFTRGVAIGNNDSPSINDIFGGTGNVAYAIAPIVGNALPPGLALATQGTGAAARLARISGTPTAAGTFTFYVRATRTGAEAADSMFTIVIQPSGGSAAVDTITFVSGALTNGTLGTAYTATVPEASGATGITYTATGLPAGLAFDAATRVISGTPTAGGNFTVRVTAHAPTSNSVGADFTLTIAPATISWTYQGRELPQGFVGDFYSAGVNFFAFGEFPVAGVGSVRYFIKDGSSLPLGLTFAAETGVIQGVPTAAVTDQRFTIIAVADPLRVVNSTQEYEFSITITQRQVVEPTPCEDSLYCVDGELVQPDLVLAQDIFIIDIDPVTGRDSQRTPTADRPMVLRYGGTEAQQLAAITRDTEDGGIWGGIKQKERISVVVNYPEPKGPTTYYFKDLNGNGVLDPYEDWRLSPWERGLDLAQKMDNDYRMSLMGSGGSQTSAVTFSGLVSDADGFLTQGIAAYRADSDNNVWGIRRDRIGLARGVPGSDGRAALQNSALQAHAERWPLGIPFAYCTDTTISWGSCQAMTGSLSGAFTGQGTRAFHASQNQNANVGTTNWIQTAGYSAIGDLDFTFYAADLHAKEFMAGGIRFLLGPMFDTISEPRWGRQYDVMAATNQDNREMMKAYVRGMQQQYHGLDGLVQFTINLKHFPTNGANAGGTGSHTMQGRWANHYVDLDLMPTRDSVPALGSVPHPGFQEFIDEGIGPVVTDAYPLSIMQCYNTTGDAYQKVHYKMPDGSHLKFSDISATFEYNLQVELLQKHLGWDGWYYTDWGVWSRDGYTDGRLQAAYCPHYNPLGTGRTLTSAQMNGMRAQMAAAAKVEHIGNGSRATWTGPFADGYVSEDWLIYAAAKGLKMMFRLGIFENPYATLEDYKKIRIENAEGAFEARVRAIALLKNDDGVGAPLPLKADREVNGSRNTFYFDMVGQGYDAALGTSNATENVRGQMSGRGTNILAELALLGVQDAQVLAEADAHTADVQVIRVTAKQAAYMGAGVQQGNPLGFCGISYNPFDKARGGFGAGGGHEHGLEWFQRIANAAGGNAINFNTTTRHGAWTGTGAPTSNIVAPGGIAAGSNTGTNVHENNARQQGRLIFNAIERKKTGSQLVIVLFAARQWSFGSRFTGEKLTGADAGKGMQPNFFRVYRPAGETSTVASPTGGGVAVWTDTVPGPAAAQADALSHIREVSTLRRFSVTQWNDGVYSGTNLYIPAGVDRDNPNFVAGDPRTWRGADDAAVYWGPEDNPINLVNKLIVGGLTSTRTLPNGVVVGSILYVDPVAAALWIAGDTATTEETAALRALQYNGNNAVAVAAAGEIISINPIRHVEFIDNPLQHIDGFVVEWGIRDEPLFSVLFGRRGRPDAAAYAPMATMPYAIYTTDTQVEFQWEDLANDLPTKHGYQDYHGFLFGYRSGLTNHGTLPMTGPATSWERGQASAQSMRSRPVQAGNRLSDFDPGTLGVWSFPEPTYINRFPDSKFRNSQQ